MVAGLHAISRLQVIRDSAKTGGINAASCYSTGSINFLWRLCPQDGLQPRCAALAEGVATLGQERRSAALVEGLPADFAFN